MNRSEAKQILAAYRPGLDDAADPIFASAIALAAKDPELKAWLEQEAAFDQLVSNELARVTPPADLRNLILRQSKVVRPTPWWTHTLTAPQLAAAACILITLTLVGIWLAERPPKFAEFRQSITQQSWGPSPHLELATDDLGKVRDFLAKQGVPSTFDVPPALAQSINGCGIIQWRGHRIPYLCAGNGGRHYHVVVAERDLFADAPPTTSPEMDRWQVFRTASWSKDDHAYIVTGLSPTAFFKTFRKSKRWDWES